MIKNKKFKLRAFISLYMTIAFFVMAISGIILFIAPPGRIANWSYWSIFGLTKAEWQATHIIFTFVFILATVLHIIYNWKPLITYLASKISGVSSIRKELTLSILFSSFLFLGTYYKVTPFVNLIDFGEEFTNSWGDEKNEPPVAHAERFTISELAIQLNISTDQLVQRLAVNGYVVKDTLQTLETLAEEYSVYPNDIYTTLISKDKATNTSSNIKLGSGLGRKKISEIFAENGLTWESGVDLLKEKNIIVLEDARLKDIATEYKILPTDIINSLISE